MLYFGRDILVFYPPFAVIWTGQGTLWKANYMVNILIADDHELIRDTVGAYLSNLDEFKIHTVASLDEAMRALEGQINFDLVVMDYRMPGMDDLNGFETAIGRFPSTKFVLMSGVAAKSVALRAMTAGAYGFFPKSLSARTMINAIRLILTGDKYFPFALVEAESADRDGECFRNLTKRETQTLRFLSQGKSNKEIAREMSVQEVTVKLHVKNVLAKLNARNRTHAALIAQEEGFV